MGVEGPPQKNLFVADLAYSVNERKLQEVFGMAGKVVMVKLNRDQHGRSKGHGVVGFDHPRDAVQAISMLNGQILCGRKMAIRFDKIPVAPTAGPSSLPEGLSGIGRGLGPGGKAIFKKVSTLFFLFFLTTTPVYI